VLLFKQQAVGESCLVAHPLVPSHVFNLNELHAKGSAVWSVPTAVGNFTLSVCNPLPNDPGSTCRATGKVAACLHWSNADIINVGE
jgi:hypothetical protein